MLTIKRGWKGNKDLGYRLFSKKASPTEKRSKKQTEMLKNKHSCEHA